MVIPTGALVQDVNITIDLDHTWSADLKVDLISPTGTVVNLATAICGAADNWDNVTFDDQALTSINVACNNSPPPAILQGSYIPNQALSVFNGELVMAFGNYKSLIRPMLMPASLTWSNWMCCIWNQGLLLRLPAMHVEK
jgi:hypothetical protein